jgi:serine/threonine protein kinase
MLRADGLVKVLDFGLAKLTEKQGDSLDSKNPTRALVKTNPGVVMGTVAYMSPEQARGLAVDVRTDVFSLGIYGCRVWELSRINTVCAQTHASLTSCAKQDYRNKSETLPEYRTRLLPVFATSSFHLHTQHRLY